MRMTDEDQGVTPAFSQAKNDQEQQLSPFDYENSKPRVPRYQDIPL